jgi:hypothetical protein
MPSAECRRCRLYSLIHAPTLARAAVLLENCSTERSPDSRSNARPRCWRVQGRAQPAHRLAHAQPLAGRAEGTGGVLPFRHRVSFHVPPTAFEADLRDNLYKIWNRMSWGPTAARLAQVPFSGQAPPVACQRDGFWREFRDQVTVGGCWRGRSASGADVVPWLGASGF